MNKRKNKYSTYFFSITKILFTIYHIQVIQFNTSHIRNTFITCTWIPSHARIIQHHSNTCPRLMSELKSCKYQSLKCKAVKTYKPKCSWILTSLISTLGGSKFAHSLVRLWLVKRLFVHEDVTSSCPECSHGATIYIGRFENPIKQI
jgi:hypothetical protein